MNFKIYDEIVMDSVEMRDTFCQSMIALADADERIILLDADLMGAMGTIPFQKRFPERTFDCGIQEANMFALSAGLSAEGKIPFAHTFGVFASRRACDQIFVSCAYAGQNVKIIGSDPGITAALNGGTHMAFEDLAIMRTIPGVTVIEPTDSVMIENLIPKIAAAAGIHYLRLVRRHCEAVYQKGSDFTVGKANLLKTGTDVTVIAMGYCVSQALIAAQRLEKKGVSAEVIDLFTLKPADRETIISSAAKTRLVVTAENHNINGALGSAVAEILSESCQVPLIRIGIPDTFGTVGFRDDLAARFQIDAASIEKIISAKIRSK